MCEMRIVAGWLLLMWASVLCVRRCAGVRCARAVRVCVLESRVEAREALKSGPGTSRHPSGGAGWAQELIQDFKVIHYT